MSINTAKFERSLFRALNAIVEPAVRKGLGSPSLAPASLIVLQTVGFKSGQARRTPLWSFGIGPYRVVSTARGDRSFWVKNLMLQPKVSFYLGGRLRQADALVIANGEVNRDMALVPAVLRKAVELLNRRAPRGWAVAILEPVRH